jgi:hypothetical protein
MTKWLLVVAAAFRVFILCPADAQDVPINADSLLRECKAADAFDQGRPLSNSENADFASCIATIKTSVTAISSIHNYYREFFKNVDVKTLGPVGVRVITPMAWLGPDSCIPTSTTSHIIVLILNKYGNQHPEELSSLPYTFIQSALADAYKCGIVK